MLTIAGGTALVSLMALFIVIRQPTFPGSRASNVAPASPERLSRDVRMLTSQFLPRDAAHPRDLERTASFIAEQFAASGARVAMQTFEARGAQYRNVIASFGPRDSRLPVLIVGAHYDAFSARAPLPGADDNASGTAGLLELARILATHPLARPVMLVAFANEEPPFFGSDAMGSAVHAQSLADQKRGVAGMICLEMIGYYSDSQSWPAPLFRLLYPDSGRFVAVSGGWSDRQLTRAVKQGIQATHAIGVYSFTAWRETSDASDQRNYWSHAWPAVMVGDTAYLRNPNYHTAHDTAGTLDYTAMAHVVDGIANAVVQLCGVR